MIRVNENENFVVSVALLDENTGELSSGQTVNYDIRTSADASLVPPITGTMVESSVNSGIYRVTESIPDGGSYIFYATCSGFITDTEEVIVNPENIYDLTKQNRHYNISVEDVPRQNAVATASQSARNVPLGKTDYVINKTRGEGDYDWSTSSTTSGIVYAWYNAGEDIPYMMGGPGV